MDGTCGLPRPRETAEGGCVVTPPVDWEHPLVTGLHQALFSLTLIHLTLVPGEIWFQLLDGWNWQPRPLWGMMGVLYLCLWSSSQEAYDPKDTNPTDPAGPGQPVGPPTECPCSLPVESSR